MIGYAKALLIAAVALIFAGPAGAQQSGEPQRAITQIAGDLYRFQNNFHVSVFLVTDAGIIATDPINAEAARWLKAEVAERFGQPIRYVVYSHDHRTISPGVKSSPRTAPSSLRMRTPPRRSPASSGRPQHRRSPSPTV